MHNAYAITLIEKTCLRRPDSFSFKGRLWFRSGKIIGDPTSARTFESAQIRIRTTLQHAVMYTAWFSPLKGLSQSTNIRLCAGNQNQKADCGAEKSSILLCQCSAAFQKYSYSLDRRTEQCSSGFR
jgi:hypothetical protein